MQIPDYPDAKIVFSDLDNTLYKGTLGIDLAKHLAGGLKAIKAVALLTATLAKYAAGRAGMEDFIQASSALFKGEDKTSGYARVREGTRKYCLGNIFTETETALRKYRERGIPVVIMGTPPQPAVEVIADAIGATRAVGIEVETDSRGRLTDRPMLPVPHGTGKLEIIQKICREQGIELKDVCYFGDSVADANVFRKVGYRVCVNAHRDLAEEARREGWPLVKAHTTRR